MAGDAPQSSGAQTAGRSRFSSPVRKTACARRWPRRWRGNISAASVYFASAGVRQGNDRSALPSRDGGNRDRGRPSTAPHTFEDLEDASFDLIVSLSPEAHHRTLEFARGLATEVVYWPTLDPTLVEGTRGARARRLSGGRVTGWRERINAFFNPRRRAE